MIFKNLAILFSCISNKRKFSLILIIGFTIFCSILEVLSLSSIIPLLDIFNNSPETSNTKIIEFLSLIPYIQINEFSSIAKLFIVLVIFSTICRIFLIWVSNFLSQTIFLDLTTRLFENTLSQDYKDFKNIESSEAVSNILIKSSTIQSSITAVINILISFIMIFFILITLFYVEGELTLYAFLSITFFYFFLSKYTRNKFINNGKIIAKEIPIQHEIISSSIRSFKDIILDNAMGKFIYNFSKSLLKLRTVSVSNIFLSQSPRYLLEGFIMIVIAGYLLYLYKNDLNQFNAISTIAFIAAAGQRLLPIINAFYSNFQSILSNNQSLSDILTTLKSEVNIKKYKKNNHSIEFNESIEFKNVSFKYKDKEKWILKDINFKISIGDSVAIIGPSGFGKTTLIDLILGLLEPTKGEILVDGININKNLLSWRDNITCVSQEPFFFDTTVHNNITLFDPNKNKQYLTTLIEIFDLKKIVNIPRVGDNASLVSGGQKQRIALARAYYRSKKIVVLDEATNALDINLEKKILRNIISKLNTHTLIVIAHRKESTSICNKTIDLSKINKVNNDNFSK